MFLTGGTHIMNEFWDLDKIYKGFEDPAYQADFAAMQQLVADFTAFAEALPTTEPLEGLRRGVALQETLSGLSSLFSYASLRQSANTKDNEAGSRMGQVMALHSGLAAPLAAYNDWVAKLPNLMELVRSDENLRDYEFLFANKAESGKYLLPGIAEAVMAKLPAALSTAMDTPPAMASMEVAMASRHRRLALRSEEPTSQVLSKEPQTILPPMKASRPKAMKWSKATMYRLRPVASSQPARGMPN
jgi:oligoendopeptidase F